MAASIRRRPLGAPPRHRRAVEQHDEWEVAERRYLSEESMALIDQPQPLEKEDLPLAITA